MSFKPDSKPPVPAEPCIVTHPHAMLGIHVGPVKRIDSNVRGVIIVMKKLLRESGGVGLAATQLGTAYRVALVVDEDPEKPIVLINPVIRSYFGGTTVADEGCLSLPGIFGPVRRSKKIKLEAYGRENEELHGIYKGELARRIQHEVDHLNGILLCGRNPSLG